MGYNKQLNDSYRVVYTDTGSTALPDISNFSHTGVYSLIAKPSQLGTAVSIGFSVVSGGKVSNTSLAEGNYFVEYSDLTTAKYWNFSFLGKASSGSKFTAQNTMVTYDKSKGKYTITTDSLSGGGDAPTPAVYIKKTADFVCTSSNDDGAETKTLTAYIYSDNTYTVSGTLYNKMGSKSNNRYVAQYKYDRTKYGITNIDVSNYSSLLYGQWTCIYTPYNSITGTGAYFQAIYSSTSSTETPSSSLFSVRIQGKYLGS